jgi:hypothetical protein
MMTMHLADVTNPIHIQLLALTSGMEYTGHYAHVDDLDLVRAKGLLDSRAWKAIDETGTTLEDTL